eukprot:3899425-Rhodomonas_salina.2
MDSTKARSGWVNWGGSALAAVAMCECQLQDSVLSNTTARSIDDVVVPTVDLSRYTLLLGWLIAGDTPILLSGPVASGKTFYVRCALRWVRFEFHTFIDHVLSATRRSRLSKGLSSLKYTNVTVNLSASSTPKCASLVACKRAVRCPALTCDATRENQGNSHRGVSKSAAFYARAKRCPVMT